MIAGGREIQMMQTFCIAPDFHYLCSCDMITKGQIKFLQSLSHKKGRDESGCFLAEGNRLVEDTLGCFACRLLVATPAWMEAHPQVRAAERITVSRDELARASQQKTPQEVLAVYEIPQHTYDAEAVTGELSLALDTVQDPGNVGTIIRIADWMGIRHIFCSPGTADVYAPKVVQATMGALARVTVHYVPLEPLVKHFAARAEVYGTFLDGDNIYDVPLAGNGLIVMGNEGNGISPAIERAVTRKLRIPNYPVGAVTCESLNVAVATAITCAEFRRRVMKG